MHVCLFDGA